MPRLNTAEFISKKTKTIMGKDRLARILYAAIMCQAVIADSTVREEDYGKSMAKNCFNDAILTVNIHPSQVDLFENLSGSKLVELDATFEKPKPEPKPKKVKEPKAEVPAPTPPVEPAADSEVPAI